MELGEKIVSLRKKKSISQALLAEHSGISLRTIQRIEKGESIPRPYTLRAIAEVLDIQIEKLNPEVNSKSNLKEEAKNVLTLSLINLSSLVGVVLPFFNILIPLILWYLNKKISLVKDKGRKVISFQILWTLISLSILTVSHIIHYKVTGEFITGRIPIVFPIYILLLSINVFFVLKNSIQLRKGNLNIYPYSPILF